MPTSLEEAALLGNYNVSLCGLSKADTVATLQWIAGNVPEMQAVSDFMSVHHVKYHERVGETVDDAMNDCLMDLALCVAANLVSVRILRECVANLADVAAREAFIRDVKQLMLTKAESHNILGVFDLCDDWGSGEGARQVAHCATLLERLPQMPTAMPDKLADDTYKGLRVLGLESFTVVYDLLQGPAAAAWLAVLNQVTLSAPDRENFAQVISSICKDKNANRYWLRARTVLPKLLPRADGGEHNMYRLANRLQTASAGFVVLTQVLCAEWHTRAAPGANFPAVGQDIDFAALQAGVKLVAHNRAEAMQLLNLGDTAASANTPCF